MATVLSCIDMIQSFKNQATEDVFSGSTSRFTRKVCPESLHNLAVRKLDLLDSVTALDELRVPPGNRLEALSGRRKGFFSIRINEKYRICFRWNNAGPSEVEITDYH